MKRRAFNISVASLWSSEENTGREDDRKILCYIPRSSLHLSREIPWRGTIPNYMGFPSANPLEDVSGFRSCFPGTRDTVFPSVTIGQMNLCLALSILHMGHDYHRRRAARASFWGLEPR